MKLTILYLLFICIQLNCAVPNADVPHDEEESLHHPVNVAVMAGQRFTFQCILDSSESDTLLLGISFVKYDYNSLARARQKQVYINNSDGVSTALIATYSVNLLSDSNGVELGPIDAASAEFSGTYVCDYTKYDSIFWSRVAELVVMVSDPICSADRDVYANTTGLHCALNFTGAYYPRMELYSSNGTLMRTCDEQSVRYTDGLLSLRCDVNVSKSEGEGAQCRTFFTDAGWRNKTPIAYAMYSTQVPSYSHTCTMHLERDADGPSPMEQNTFQGLNTFNLLVILVAAGGGLLFVAGIVVIVLRFRQNGCGSEKKAIAPDVVAQSSMIDSELHLARRTAQDNDYATMPEGRRAAAVVAPPIPSPRPLADSTSGDAANEQIVGADGTIYARLDLAARQASHAQRGGFSPPPQPPQPAEPSIYAFIDHTLRVDDLPPRAANKRK